jgi:hypothetical protein
MPPHTHSTPFDYKGFAEDVSRGEEEWHAAGINQASWGSGWRSLRTINFGTMSSAGGGAPIDVRPPYMGLYYIMKLP